MTKANLKVQFSNEKMSITYCNLPVKFFLELLVTPKPTSQACTVALLSGYLVRVLLEQEFCGDCVAR
jgi:hypothetical protein